MQQQTAINELFDLLDTWRLLPNYQLERRADIFFALFLPKILEKPLKGKPILKIIPEFPVRIGTIYPQTPINKSFKIDYMVVTEEKVFLVELKTETSSRRPKQDLYLERAAEENVQRLMDGLLRIFSATSSKTKYRRLMKELEEINWLKQVDGRWENTCQDKEMEIVFIQPEAAANTAGKWVIGFDEVAAIVEQQAGELARRFAESIRKWKKSANKK